MNEQTKQQQNSQTLPDETLLYEFVDGQEIPMPNNAEPSLLDKYQSALEEIENLKNQRLLALAEADNIKKRALKDLDDFRKYAVSPLAREIFPVADTLYHAVRAIDPKACEQDKNLNNLAVGLNMTVQMFNDAFARVGIKEIAKIGDKFDPNLHQAVSESPATEQCASGCILSIIQQGFGLHDRLLRPAMVVVAK